MLRRGTSNRVTRRKSATSIHNQPSRTLIDPEISRQQAYVAAIYAFARAQERSSADMEPKSTVARSNATKSENVNMSSRPKSEASGRVLKHQQSVRFAGPLAAPRPALGTRTVQYNPIQKKMSTKSLRRREIMNYAPARAAYRPLSRSSSWGKTSSIQVGPGGFTSTQAAYIECDTREDEVITTPSSYRKIRRSKSLLNPGKVSGVLFNNGTRESLVTGQNNNSLLRSKSNLTLRAPKSMRILRGTRSSSAQNPEYDVAVQIARDKFLHQVEQQRLREQPSFLFRSSKSRKEKSFRSSLSTNSSTNSYGLPVVSENQTQHRVWDGTLRRKARQASKSFKSKLKGLFRRNKGERGASIPDQEIQAQKSHVTDYEIHIGPPTTLSSSYDQPQLSDYATLSRIYSRQPSLSMAPSNQKLRSIAGSMQSISSEASSKYRITSWTNSEITANSRHTAAEREQQRLSVINENGTHRTSSSFPRLPLRNQFTAYPAFHLPGSSQGHPLPPIGPVDSARVYSALMRRLDENSPEAKLTQQKESTRISPTPNHELPRRSPADSCQSSHGYKSTIIKVKNSCEELFTSTNSSRNTPQSHDVFFTARSYTDSGSVGYKCGRSNSSASTVVTKRPNYRAYPPPVMGDMPNQMTRHEHTISNKFQGLVSKGPRETRSIFFGGSELTNIGGSPSPYRRAMAEADFTSATSKMTISADSSPFLPDNLRGASSPLSQLDRALDKRSSDEIDGGYTESIYSRTTSGRTPPEINESVQARKKTPQKFNSALLADTSTYRISSPLCRVNTSAGTTEWKVSKLEKMKENVDAASSAIHVIPHIVPTMPKKFGGHVRETAEISGDDMFVVAPNTTEMLNQPLRVMEQNDSMLPKPVLKYKASLRSLLVPNFPPTSSQRETYNWLRQAPSRSSMKSVNMVLTERAVSNTATNVMINVAESSPNSQGESAKTRPRMVRKQSSATLRGAQTPNRLVKKNGQRGSNADTQTPSPGAGLIGLGEKQFGSVGGRLARMENWMPARVDEAEGDDCVMVGRRDEEVDKHALGSRRMVDLFLSSRRRRVAGSEDSDVFL